MNVKHYKYSVYLQDKFSHLEYFLISGITCASQLEQTSGVFFLSVGYTGVQFSVITAKAGDMHEASPVVS